jgi:hypothetical protein
MTYAYKIVWTEADDNGCTIENKGTFLVNHPGVDTLVDVFSNHPFTYAKDVCVLEIEALGEVYD